jgi:Predicted membrane protein
VIAVQHFLEETVSVVAKIGISLVELAGIMVLLITAAQGVWHYFKHSPHIRLELAQGIALALEFKLGGEVLRTVITRDWNELLILGAIILLRAALTVLLHWEIRNEEAHMEVHDRRALRRKARIQAKVAAKG